MRSIESQFKWCAKVQWLLAAIAVGAGVAFCLTCYRPLSAKLRAADEQVAQAQHYLASNQDDVQKLPHLAAQIERRQARIERNAKRLPSQPEVVQYVHDITQVSQQASLKDFSVQPMAPRTCELFSELPICMSFEGDFLNAALFLRQVEDLPRLNRIRRLRMMCRDEQSGNVQVEVTMNVYYSER